MSTVGRRTHDFNENPAPNSGADGVSPSRCGGVWFRTIRNLLKKMLAHFQKGISCAEGGPEGQLAAADPRDEVLGPFDARLETCASRSVRI